MTTYNGAGEVVEVEFPYDPQRIAAMDLAALDILSALSESEQGQLKTLLEKLQKKWLSDHAEHHRHK